MYLISRYLTSHIQWIIFIGIVIFIKVTIFYLDPFPMFFLGDSQSYITTALNSWIPPDRSFVYGFVIRVIAVSTHSLKILVAFQVFLSTFTALLATYSLERFFYVSRKLAFTMGIFCAIEPLQLLYERYVLTETLSLFVLAIYMFLIFKYLEKPKLSLMVVIQIIGTVLISVRLSFLPLTVFNAFLLPLLNIQFFRGNSSFQPKNYAINSFYNPLRKKWLMKTTLHLIVSLVTMFSFHSGYKQLYGFLFKGPPTYLYHSGFFLLADWAPVAKPEDLPYPKLFAKIFGNVLFDLTDRNTRVNQRWSNGGLISNINTSFPDPLEAEWVAKRTAINALKRDPFGVATLAVQGFLDYWNKEKLKKCMFSDRGGDRELPQELLQTLKDNFGIDAESFPTIKTLTNTYYFFAWPGYLILLCTPFFALFCLFFCHVKLRKYFCIIFIATFALVIIASALIERPTIRYLHALEWLFIFILGFSMKRFLTILNGNKIAPASQMIST